MIWVRNGAANFHCISLNQSLLTESVPIISKPHLCTFRLQTTAIYCLCRHRDNIFTGGRISIGSTTTCFLVAGEPHNYHCSLSKYVFRIKTDPFALIMLYNILLKIMPRFTLKLQMPSWKTFKWTVTLIHRNLPRKPSIDRKNWYIFSILVALILITLMGQNY